VSRLALPLLLLAILVSGSSCGSPDFWYFQSITSGPNPGSTLILVWLSDSPVDSADAVKVTVERVELIGTDGPVLISDQRQSIDLLTLQNGKRVKLAEGEVPEGTYERVRLTLASTGSFTPTIDVGGAVRPLDFVNASGHVVDVPYVLLAASEATAEIQLDFNVRLSVDEVGGDWTLAPHVDAVNPAAVGRIAGRVVDGLGLPVSGVTLVASQGGLEIRSTRTAPDGTYEIGLLPPGSYDVALWGVLGPLQEETGLLVGVGMTTTLDFVR